MVYKQSKPPCRSSRVLVLCKEIVFREGAARAHSPASIVNCSGTQICSARGRYRFWRDRSGCCRDPSSTSRKRIFGEVRHPQERGVAQLGCRVKEQNRFRFVFLPRASLWHRRHDGGMGITPFHRCQTSSCARHESRAVRRHHEDHRPEHIEGEQAPGGKRPKGASSRLSLAAPGRLEPFQRACSATVPEKSLRCAIFPNFRLESGRNGGRGFYESIKLTQTQGHPQILLKNRSMMVPGAHEP